MKRKTIDIITLGCSKNLVDSEHLMRQLEEAGFHVTHDAERPKGEIAVINTCGFIGDAKEESINMILEFAQAKEEGELEKLYVMGCLSERYLKELAIEIPQVDKFYGKFNWKELLQDLGKVYHDELHIEAYTDHSPALCLSENIGRVRPQMLLLCDSYYYGPACVASYGRNSGRGEVSCGPRSERVSGYCAGIDLLWCRFI